MTTYTGYISRTFLQLDDARQEELSTFAASLLAQQREEEVVRDHGALTRDQLMGMTLGDLERHARKVGVRASAVMRVAEANAS